MACACPATKRGAGMRRVGAPSPAIWLRLPRPPKARAAAAQPTLQDDLRGPVLPESSQEGQVGPQKRPPGSGGSVTTPAPGLPAGGPPAGEGETAPPAGGTAGPDGPAEGAPPEGAPGTTAPDALPDPFGAAPPAPPAWMVDNVDYGQGMNAGPAISPPERRPRATMGLTSTATMHRPPCRPSCKACSVPRKRDRPGRMLRQRRPRQRHATGDRPRLRQLGRTTAAS